MLKRPYKRNGFILFVTFLLIVSCDVCAQRLDSLSFGERFSVHTNTIDWALAIPNVGVEFDLGSKPKTNKSIGLHVKYRPSLWNEWKPRLVFNVWQVRGEYRHYWRTFNYGSAIERDTTLGFVSSNVSYVRRRYLSGVARRRARVWRAYYVGLYAEADRYTYEFTHDGRQGEGFGAGVTAGYTLPLYPFASGSSIDLDMGVSVGLRMEEYDEFDYEEESHCYAWGGHRGRHLVGHPVLADAHISFVYRFGSIARKVHGGAERFAVRESARKKRGTQRIINMGIEALRRDSIHQADSIAKVRKQAEKKRKAEERERARAEARAAAGAGDAAGTGTLGRSKRRRRKNAAIVAEGQQSAAQDSTSVQPVLRPDVQPVLSGDSTSVVTPVVTPVLIPTMPLRGRGD